MRAACRAMAFLVCLSVAGACGAPRSQRVCGILYTKVVLPGETTHLRLIEPDSGAEHTVLTTQDAAFGGGLAPRWQQSALPVEGRHPMGRLLDHAPGWLQAQACPIRW